MLRRSRAIATALPVGIGVGLLFLVPTSMATGEDSGPPGQEVSRDRARPRSEPRADGAERATQRPAEADPQVVYVPPRRGAPRTRVPGGLRGAPALPTPLVLAPDHVAETVSERPSLFWHIDSLPGGEVQLLFTLIDEQQIDPVAELLLAPPTRPGIQRIDLDRHGIALAPGVEYEWSIALVADEEHRSHDRISTGSIRRVLPPESLQAEPATAQAYAANGLWYDAFASISDALEASPADPALRSQRDALLRQTDLGAALR